MGKVWQHIETSAMVFIRYVNVHRLRDEKRIEEIRIALDINKTEDKAVNLVRLRNRPSETSCKLLAGYKPVSKRSVEWLGHVGMAAVKFKKMEQAISLHGHYTMK